MRQTAAQQEAIRQATAKADAAKADAAKADAAKADAARAEAARKIQLGMTLDMVREAAKQPHTQPLVTVAIRSGGSVESVAIRLH